MNTNAKYSAEDVVELVIDLSSKKFVDDDTPEGITPLKLQKILYFSQAAFLVVTGKPLFKEEIEAWKYGPVISSIYRKYRDTENKVLINSSPKSKISDSEVIQLVTDVWEIFNKFSASELVDITHNHKPWRDVYEAGKNNIIKSEVLLEYYKNIFTTKEQ